MLITQTSRLVERPGPPGRGLRFSLTDEPGFHSLPERVDTHRLVFEIGAADHVAELTETETAAASLGSGRTEAV
jgi:hypothetical protein